VSNDVAMHGSKPVQYVRRSPQGSGDAPRSRRSRGFRARRRRVVALDTPIELGGINARGPDGERCRRSTSSSDDRERKWTKAQHGEAGRAEVALRPARGTDELQV